MQRREARHLKSLLPSSSELDWTVVSRMLQFVSEGGSLAVGTDLYSVVVLLLDQQLSVQASKGYTEVRSRDVQNVRRVLLRTCEFLGLGYSDLQRTEAVRALFWDEEKHQLRRWIEEACRLLEVRGDQNTLRALKTRLERMSRSSDEAVAALVQERLQLCYEALAARLAVVPQRAKEREARELLRSTERKDTEELMRPSWKDAKGENPTQLVRPTFTEKEGQAGGERGAE